jgi:hypothetical protein
MMKKNKTKELLDNPYATQYGATQAELFDTISRLDKNELVKITFRKKPNKNSRDTAVQTAVKQMSSLTLADFQSGRHESVLKTVIDNYQGELVIDYYKRPEQEELRNKSGYILMNNEDGEWKSVDVKNIISICRAGTLQTREQL